MGILTISRELGSGGDAIGKKVAQELGWTLLDNDGFAAAAQSYGYVRAELEQVDERKPGLIDRFFRDRQLVYLDIMRAIVYESALKNDFVILGRGSHILLEGIEGVFRARIVAPREYRQRTLVKQRGDYPFHGGAVHTPQRRRENGLYAAFFRRQVGRAEPLRHHTECRDCSTKTRRCVCW